MAKLDSWFEDCDEKHPHRAPRDALTWPVHWGAPTRCLFGLMETTPPRNFDTSTLAVN